jgi:hypothetical protein
MPKKIQDCSKAHLISIELPVHGDTYTVISHESVIDYAYTELANAGFGIVHEEYRATADGQIAQGIYKLNYNNDPELNMMFAWTNSYNKQVRFKCGVGAYVNQTGTVMVCGDMGSWARKHTGSADAETIQTIKDQIADATMYYNQLVSDKESMKTISMNKRKQAQMLGILFAEYQIITTEQASMIRNQMDRPIHVFEDSNSLWAFYNYVTTALQNSHPKTWMEDQRVLHYFISSINNFAAPQVTPEVVEVVVDPLTEIPNQTNIIDQIAEIEAQEEIVIHVESDQEYLERVADIEGEPEVVQEEVEIDTVLHQSDEIILETAEDKSAFINDEVVSYTDPAGNTFIVPVVETEVPQEFIDALMNAQEIDASEVDMSKVTWVDAPVPTLEPTPEEHEIMETELNQEANLDLLQPEEQVKEKEDVADFDLDFASNVDVEEEDNDIADFF